MAKHLDSSEYSIEWIPVKNLLVIWQDAQRPYIDAWSEQIAREFDPERFDVITTTLPNGNGQYHIIDGQHRTSAVKKLYGDSERVPCRVLEEINPDRAAHIFRWMQKGRKRVSPIDDFLVGVAAKDEPEYSVDKIVRAAGLRVDRTKTAKTVMAVGALRSVYAISPHILKQSLQAILAVWGTEESSALSGDIINGYGIFLSEFGSYVDWVRLRATIGKKYTPDRLVIAAKSKKENEGGTIGAAVAFWLRSTYNKGLPEKKKLKSKGSSS